MDIKNLNAEHTLKRCQKYPSELHVIESANRFKTIAHPNMTTRYSHKVTLEEDAANASQRWYKKEMSSQVCARIECLTQEFLRLLIPRQPETRLGFNPSNQVYYVFSKEILNYVKLPCKQDLDGQTLKGLGEIVIGAYFLHEIDLKNGNIGLNAQNEVCKIDGDWAFAWKRDPDTFPIESATISAEEISRLPFLSTYECYHWFDLVKEGERHAYSVFFDHSITTHMAFNHEKYLTILKILLMPDSYLKHFVDSFFSSGASQYIGFLIKRRDELLAQVRLIPEFINYVQQDRGFLTRCSLLFHERMLDFRVYGQWEVISESNKKTFASDAAAQLQSIGTALNITVEHDLSDKISNLALSKTNSSISLYVSPSSSIFDVSSLENSYQNRTYVPIKQDLPEVASVDRDADLGCLTQCCYGFFNWGGKQQNAPAVCYDESYKVT